GTVWCWGSAYRAIPNAPRGPAAVPGWTHVAEVSVGLGYTCARTDAGTVQCEGTRPGRVSDPSAARWVSPTAIPDVTAAAQLSAGPLHACVRTAAGTAQCWGSNLDNLRSQVTGQLGAATPSYSDRALTLPGLTNVAEVVAGWSLTCARLTDGTVRCLGAN